MRPKFLHVLATRHGIGVFDEGWFRYRQLLFEKLTLPSVRAQTTDEFLWLIAIDNRMPPAAKRRLELMVGESPNIELVEFELLRDLRAGISAIAQERARAIGAEFVLSSRLDDDDAMNVELFERMHFEVNAFLDLGKPKRAVFAPVIGVEWLPKMRRGRPVFRESHSIALSILEPVERLETVYKWPHKKVKSALVSERAYFRNLDGDTVWWLYSATSLSDQNNPEIKREENIAGGANAFDLTDDELKAFGLDPVEVNAIGDVPEPVAVDTTFYLTKRNHDVEKQIGDLRKELQRKTADDVPRDELEKRISRLHSKRLELGSNIVR